MRMQIVESINESLAPLRDIDWEEVERSWKKSAEKLGKRLDSPNEHDAREVIGLSQIEDQEELDSTLFDFTQMKRNIDILKLLFLNMS